MNTKNMTIREILQELLYRGYTRTEMARLSGVSISTVSRIITGEYMDMDYTPGKRLERLLACSRRTKI